MTVYMNYITFYIANSLFDSSKLTYIKKTQIIVLFGIQHLFILEHKNTTQRK
jgi:uncharacterized protein YhhL (DUF1145 family)